MASITIRNLDDSITRRLITQAASNNRSVEEEACQILREALLVRGTEQGIGTLIHKRFMTEGGVELPAVQRNRRARKPIDLK